VLVTAWGGYYLGAMHSGVSSVQRGLLGALLGIGLVSAGAGALNEALERKTDARMKRTADRPLAAGRFSLAQGVMAGMGALIPGRSWTCISSPIHSPRCWRC
jgi:protoheme IX farnesyltransferase